MVEKETQTSHHKEDATDKTFKTALYLKGLDGLLETLGGVLLLLIKPEQVNHLARWLTQGELSQDPHDFIANHILKTAHSLTGSSLAFGAAYLLSHGLVKIILVIEVLREHLWAYLGLIIVTALFVIYQVYRLAVVKFSVSLFLLTLFDLLIIYLTQKEYRRHRQARA
ncbi:MAG: DUF2127 domain-containing protein [Candidatus Saccharimonadales bacterium]